jgi:hypothetical protein
MPKKGRAIETGVDIEAERATVPDPTSQVFVPTQSRGNYNAGKETLKLRAFKKRQIGRQAGNLSFRDETCIAGSAMLDAIPKRPRLLRRF